jgi:hypothetical protein
LELFPLYSVVSLKGDWTNAACLSGEEKGEKKKGRKEKIEGERKKDKVARRGRSRHRGVKGKRRRKEEKEKIGM